MFFVWLLLYGAVTLLSHHFASQTPWAIPAGLFVSTAVLVGWQMVKQRGTLVNWRKIALPRWKHHLFFLPYLLPTVCNLICFGYSPHPASAFVSILLAVVLEEVLFRGVILQFFCRRSYVFGILFSAILFAAAHLLNLENNIAPLYVLYQAVFALVAGLAFAGIALSCETLLPCIGLHFLINITAFDSVALPEKFPLWFWLCNAVYLICGIRSIYSCSNLTKKGCPYESVH